MAVKEKITTLYKGKFVELRQKETDEYKYEYLHESRCDGNIVAMLPVNMENIEPSFLIRNEYTPCWGDRLFVSSITGGVEPKKHKTPIEAVIEEMKEEAGFIIDATRVFSAGYCRGTKSSDTLYHLFIIDLSFISKDKIVPIEGDGTSLESKANNQWVDKQHLIQHAEDPLLYVLFTRYINKNITPVRFAERLQR